MISTRTGPSDDKVVIGNRSMHRNKRAFRVVVIEHKVKLDDYLRKGLTGAEHFLIKPFAISEPPV